jgi:hypothetical protein
MNKGILIIILLLQLLSSCTTRFDSWQKKSQIIKKEYPNSKESICIPDIILCSYYKKGLWTQIQTIDLNRDSIVEILKLSLNKLDLNLSFSNIIRYHCESVYTPNNKNFYMNINPDEMVKLKSLNSCRFNLIPFIRIVNQDITFITPTASSGSPAGGMKRDPMVGIVVYLFDNNELIYLRRFNFSGKVINVYKDEHGNILDEDTDKPVKSTIEQKHWDKLVELVMRDYIKGVNRYKKKNHIFD